jgi:O-antigen/teichoic acid export membrane protein
VLGVESNAILAVTHKLPNLCQTLFSRFHLSWQQSASETINSSDRDRFFNTVFNSLIKTMGSLILFLLAVNILFFKILYTEEYFAGYYITPILLVAMLAYMVAQFLGGINIAKMESQKNGFTTVIGAVVNIVVHLILIKVIGLYAAVVSTLIAYITILIVRYIDVRKEIKLHLEKSGYFLLLLILYFFIQNYIGNDLFHYINIVLAVVVCVYMNKDVLFSIWNKVLKRSRER